MKDTGISSDKKEIELFFKILDNRSITQLVEAGSDKKSTMQINVKWVKKVKEVKEVKEEKEEEPEDIEFGMGLEYDDDYEGGSIEKSDHSFNNNNYWTVEQALVVLRYEAELRTGKEY